MNRYQRTREGIREVARQDAERGVYNNTYRRDDYRLSYTIAHERWAALTPAERVDERAARAARRAELDREAEARSAAWLALNAAKA